MEGYLNYSTSSEASNTEIVRATSKPRSKTPRRWGKGCMYDKIAGFLLKKKKQDFILSEHASVMDPLDCFSPGN